VNQVFGFIKKNPNSEMLYDVSQSLRESGLWFHADGSWDMAKFRAQSQSFVNQVFGFPGDNDDGLCRSFQSQSFVNQVLVSDWEPTIKAAHLSRNPFVNLVFGFVCLFSIFKEPAEVRRSQSLRESGLWFPGIIDGSEPTRYPLSQYLRESCLLFLCRDSKQPHFRLIDVAIPS
jgi:hypothetical protein